MIKNIFTSLFIIIKFSSQEIVKKEKSEYSENNNELDNNNGPDFPAPIRHGDESVIIKTEQVVERSGKKFHFTGTFKQPVVHQREFFPYLGFFPELPYLRTGFLSEKSSSLTELTAVAISGGANPDVIFCTALKL